MPDISYLFLCSAVSTHWTKLESMFLINSRTEGWHNVYAVSSKACCQIIVHIFKCEQGSGRNTDHTYRTEGLLQISLSWRAISHRNTPRAKRPRTTVCCWQPVRDWAHTPLSSRYNCPWILTLGCRPWGQRQETLLSKLPLHFFCCLFTLTCLLVKEERFILAAGTGPSTSHTLSKQVVTILGMYFEIDEVQDCQL